MVTPNLDQIMEESWSMNGTFPLTKQMIGKMVQEDTGKTRMGDVRRKQRSWGGESSTHPITTDGYH